MPTIELNIPAEAVPYLQEIGLDNEAAFKKWIKHQVKLLIRNHQAQVKGQTLQNEMSQYHSDLEDDFPDE